MPSTHPNAPAFGSECGCGMYLREYIATQALCGVLAMFADHNSPEPHKERAAQLAVSYADALIAELNKPVAPVTTETPKD